MNNQHTILEDIGAAIGYTATTRLVGWAGGANLYVPTEASSEHPLWKVLGAPAYQRFVAAFGGDTIFIPVDSQADEIRQWNCVFRLLQDGCSYRTVCVATNLSARQVANIRRQLEDVGLLTPIMKGCCASG